MYQIKRGDEVLIFRNPNDLINFISINVDLDILDSSHFSYLAGTVQDGIEKGRQGWIDFAVKMIGKMAAKYGLTIEKVKDV